MYSYCYTMKIRFDQDQKSCPQTSARCRMALKFQDTKLSQNGFGKILSTGRRILENLEKGGTHYCRKLTNGISQVSTACACGQAQSLARVSCHSALGGSCFYKP